MEMLNPVLEGPNAESVLKYSMTRRGVKIS